jgi:hypothetical protein
MIGEISLKKKIKFDVELKYSFIDWRNQKHAISQVQLTCLSRGIKIYLGYLMNHIAIDLIHGRYLGIFYENRIECHPWNLDIIYQELDENCVPIFDATEFGRSINMKISYAQTDHLTYKAKLFIYDYKKQDIEIGVNYTW